MINVMILKMIFRGRERTTRGTGREEGFPLLPTALLTSPQADPLQGDASGLPPLCTREPHTEAGGGTGKNHHAKGWWSPEIPPSGREEGALHKPPALCLAEL